MCKAKGKIVSATVVDHIIPLRQAPELRLDPANLQPLCNYCHNSTKRREENKTRPPTMRVGADGLPVNENHPFYTGSRVVN
jgi:5-methylcytosine-specific restriction endonuclease McrA